MAARAASTTRAAMQHNNGHTTRIAALFDIDAMAVAKLHHALIERVNRRIKMADALSLVCDFVHIHPI